jgi:hypothetical protein
VPEQKEMRRNMSYLTPFFLKDKYIVELVPATQSLKNMFRRNFINPKK